MPLNTDAAKELLNHIKVIPSVKKYKNNINIITASNSPVNGLYTSASLGLSNYSINMVTPDKKDLRVEIMSSYPPEFIDMRDVLAECADRVVDKSYIIRPGVVFPNIIKNHYPLATTCHILFTAPYLFPNLKNINKEDMVITWLMAVGITEKEYNYLEKNGYQVLEQKLEKNNVDVFNINRQSLY